MRFLLLPDTRVTNRRPCTVPILKVLLLSEATGFLPLLPVNFFFVLGLQRRGFESAKSPSPACNRNPVHDTWYTQSCFHNQSNMSNKPGIHSLPGELLAEVIGHYVSSVPVADVWEARRVCSTCTAMIPGSHD